MAKKALLALLAAAIFSGWTAQSFQETPPVIAEGSAEIGTGGKQEARALAQMRAKQKALEHLGVGIRAESLVSDGRLLDEYALIQTNGYVSRSEILEEGEYNGIYKIRMKVWAKPDLMEAECQTSPFFERRIIVSAEGEGAQHLKRGVMNLFTSRFFKVIGDRGSKSDYEIRISSKITENSHFATIHSYAVYAQIVMYKTGEESPLLHIDTGGPITIYGHNLENALNGPSGNQYHGRVAELLLSNFVSGLDQLADRALRVVLIKIENLPDAEAFAAFRDHIAGIRFGMGGILYEQYDGGGSGFLKTAYKEKSHYLALLIEKYPSYRVTAYRWDQVRVAFKKESVDRFSLEPISKP